MMTLLLLASLLAADNDKVSGNIKEYVINGGIVKFDPAQVKEVEKVLEKNNFKYEPLGKGPVTKNLYLITPKNRFEDPPEYRAALEKVADCPGVLLIEPNKRFKKPEQE